MNCACRCARKFNVKSPLTIYLPHRILLSILCRYGFVYKLALRLLNFWGNFIILYLSVTVLCRMLVLNVMSRPLFVNSLSVC